MSIESKHAYRFGYLKSEQWSNVRLEALAREKGRCEICGEESISNDAHHVWYPKNIYETTERHLVILCRPCHNFIHSMLPECKHRDEEKGIKDWLNFKNAILTWRAEKVKIFSASGKSEKLRLAYEQLKKNYEEDLFKLNNFQNSSCTFPQSVRKADLVA